MSEPFERLEATHGNGLAIQDILLEDYRRIGVSDDDAYRMVHGTSGDALHEMVRRMEDGNGKEYYGVREESLLAGFAVLGDWKAGDERAFMKPSEFYTARLFEKRDEILTSGEVTYPYDGIHAFGVAHFADSYESVAVPLIDGLRARAAERGKIAVRAAIDLSDERLMDIFEREGKKVTSKIGSIAVGGVVRRYELHEIETA